jgi:hypothetical protein
VHPKITHFLQILQTAAKKSHANMALKTALFMQLSGTGTGLLYKNGNIRPATASA